MVDPSAQQGGTCTNLPVSYYKNARDIKVYVNNTDVNIIQPGEGDGVSGSTPPCDAYLLMYAFMCAGLLFGLSLLLYVLASVYTERLVRVRGIRTRMSPSHTVPRYDSCSGLCRRNYWTLRKAEGYVSCFNFRPRCSCFNRGLSCVVYGSGVQGLLVENGEGSGGFST